MTEKVKTGPGKGPGLSAVYPGVCIIREADTQGKICLESGKLSSFYTHFLLFLLLVLPLGRVPVPPALVVFETVLP